MNLKSRYLEITDEVQQTYQKYLNQKNNNLNSNHSEGHKPEIIAVSKTFSSQLIQEVFTFGQKAFAENYVNEFVEKHEQLSDLDIQWHFIGHLQTNKVDKVVGKVEMIHSVDSEKLLKKIINLAEKKSIVQKILLQVKFGNEETKHGFDLKDLDLVIEAYKTNPSIKICGLMCILPLEPGRINTDTEKNKTKYFSLLREKLFQLRDAHNLSSEFKELSMGMSDDFKLAILEGSTMIRVGSALFGARL